LSINEFCHSQTVTTPTHSHHF